MVTFNNKNSDTIENIVWLCTKIKWTHVSLNRIHKLFCFFLNTNTKSRTIKSYQEKRFRKLEITADLEMLSNKATSPLKVLGIYSTQCLVRGCAPSFVTLLEEPDKTFSTTHHSLLELCKRSGSCNTLLSHWTPAQLNLCFFNNVFSCLYRSWGYNSIPIGNIGLSIFRFLKNLHRQRLMTPVMPMSVHIHIY